MKRKLTAIMVFLIFFIFSTNIIYANGVAGKIVFTKSEFTREGFEDDIIKSNSGKRGWWELSKSDICIIEPNSSEVKQLTNDGLSYRPKWSPDASKIAFCSGPSTMISLNVMDSDGSNRIELLTNQEQIYDFRWSPDGTKILVFLKSKISRNPEEAWIVNIRDKNVDRMGSSEWARGWNHWDVTGSTILNPNKRLVSALPAGIAWPEWSPDNKYIAFITNGRLAIADTAKTGMLDSWKPTKTEPPSDRIGNWSWNADSKKFLFFARGNVCSINFDGTDVKNLSMCSAYDACWSPDASYVAFTSNDGRKRNSEIFIMKSDGTEQTQLTNTNYFHSELDWK